MTTEEEEEAEEEEKKKTIVLLVKLLPEPNKEEHKNLTRFQIRDPRSKCFGKTCVFRDLDKTKTTVADVKRMVERDVGEKVEMLRRGEKNYKVVVSFRFSVSVSLSLSLSRVRARARKKRSLVKVDVVTHMSLFFFNPKHKEARRKE